MVTIKINPRSINLSLNKCSVRPNSAQCVSKRDVRGIDTSVTNWVNSKNLSMIDLTAVGVAMTTPRPMRAAFNFLNNAGVISELRSNERVYIRLCMIVENVDRMTEREKSNNAGGTTCHK